jgi:hypothetical protein
VDSEHPSSRERLEAQLRERERLVDEAPEQVVRKFLRTFVQDADSMDEVREELVRSVESNSRPVTQASRALQSLLASPPRDGSLATMVAVDANRSLDDPSDAGAIEWLTRLAHLTTEVLSSHAE